MHAGASERWPSKRWEAASYAALAQTLQGRGFTVIWIGGVADRAVNRRLAAETGIDATAAFSFMELLALGRHACFAVVNDSGPMHLLAAAALPVYAFFGPTDWRRSHAPGQQRYILHHAVQCSPCFLPECPPEHGHRCLRAISPATVVARLEADGRL
jgi:ADP-heptose:LPS heptosyltransferase